MGDICLCIGSVSNCDNGCSDIIHGFKMNKKSLQFFSLLISALVILYLLAVNIFRGTFITSDWLIVIFDLSVKMVVELTILFKNNLKKRFNQKWQKKV